MSFPWLTSLYGRIFAIFWFTVLSVVVVITVLLQVDPRTGQALPQSQQQRLSHMASNITNTLNNPYNATFAAKPLNQQLQQLVKRRDHHAPRLYFTTLEGDILSPAKHTKILRNFTTIADDPLHPKQRLYGRRMLAGPVKINTPQGDIYMYSSQRWQGSPPFISQILNHPLKLLLLTMVVSTPLLLWLAWAVTRPARRLQQAAEHVAQGQFTADPTLETGPREFSQAGASFNQMVGALNTMISGQQRLLSDISHELRSPLTRLRMATALAQRKQGESNELSRIDTEADRLEAMISELLELSRMQINSHQHHEPLDCQSLWYDMLEDACFEAEQCHKVLHYNNLQPWPLHGNPNLLISALENVIRNAIKYGNDVIQVHFHAQAHHLIITIDDNGEGVPNNELNEIFRPFYRTSTARDRTSGGTGLGLAITESAIHQHRGTIQAQQSALGGLNITITLPIHSK